MAIKLNNCLTMSQQEFLEWVIENNQELKSAFTKNPNYKYDPVLPKPDKIYEREFHFMDGTLLQRQNRKESRLLKKKLKAAQLALPETNDDKIDNQTNEEKNDVDNVETLTLQQNKLKKQQSKID